ncbi:MAG: hypothetical protein QOI50_1392 [Pseudonocardiales bacterium]|nr:hypothetical protein [Pseudonocardiales bacterium]
MTYQNPNNTLRGSVAQGSNDPGVDLGETCALAEIDAVGYTYGPARTVLVLPLLVGDRGVTSSGWVRVRSLTSWPAGPGRAEPR